MYVVVCYDVVEDRVRARVLKVLDDYLAHVQKSVFEGELPESRFYEMFDRLRQEIDLDADSVRIYHLCARCRPAVEILGTGRVVEGATDEII